MKDETYAFISDVKEKKVTARSARNVRTHAGKGGRVKFPSDYLTRKELNAMNGEVKSYKLNDPLSWNEFKSMPDDIKVTYIKLLREKYGVPDCKIGEMMGVNKCTMSQEIKRIGLGHGEKHGGYKGWDKEGFYAWANGVDTLPTPVIEEPEEAKQEPEEDIPFELEAFCHEKPKLFPVFPEIATPCNGNMTFKCPANQALNTLGQVLGKTNCEISVIWRVVEEGNVSNG